VGGENVTKDQTKIAYRKRQKDEERKADFQLSWSCTIFPSWLKKELPFWVWERLCRIWCSVMAKQ